MDSLPHLETDKVSLLTELVARAIQLGPAIAARREATLANRSVPQATIDDLQAAGLFKACLPARFGGYQLPFGAHTLIAQALGQLCGSTAWVAAVIGSHQWSFAKYPIAFQQAIWGAKPDALTASAYANRGGRAIPVAGGVRISGTWMYCSGIDNADWASLLCPVVRADGPPVMHMIALPKGDYRIDPVWRSPGMRGTGSHDVVVEDVFVPDHLAVPYSLVDRVETEGSAWHGGWTYRVSAPALFAYSVAGPLIGIAQGALAAFVDEIRARSQGFTGARLAEFPTLQLRASEASGDIDAAQLMYDADMALARAAAREGRDLDQGERMRIKRNCGWIALACKRAVLRLVEGLGAGGLDDRHPVQIAYQDVLAAGSHIALTWDINGQPYGKYLFGLEHQPIVR